MIADNLKNVTQRIAKCCEKRGVPANMVKLVCVTKEASIEEISEVLSLGVTILGENRVQDAAGKYKIIGDKVSWHLIGHLQTNKVRDAVGIFSLIHSVDSVRLAREIDKEAARAGKVQDILIQVNTSGEGTKFGIQPGELDVILKEISNYNNIRTKGLMTIAPESKDPETIRPCFRTLKKLMSVNSKLQILSMGMSNDFEIAIEEGSNMVRIGRAIFG